MRARTERPRRHPGLTSHRIGTGSQKHNPGMHVGEESNTGVVPAKQPNKTRGDAGGGGCGGRPVTEENSMEPNNQPTQSGARMSQGLNGVRERARKNKQEQFTALLHHVTVDLLRDSYYGLKRKAAPGVDGVTWKEYETGLEDRLKDLHGRVHRGAYRATPSRRIYILKANGKTKAAGNRGAGRQDCPKCGGQGPQSDIRGRLSGILLRISARSQPTWGAGRAVCGDPREEGELDTRHGPERLFR